MRYTRIYTTQSLSEGALLSLEENSSRHIARALRLDVGAAITLFNGQRGEYTAEIVALDKKHVQVKVGALSDVDRESPLSIHLGIALSRGERMDWIVQKSTELGVSSIAPLLSERTGVKLAGDRAENKLRHWQQIAVSACEQCGRNRVPIVQPITSLPTWVATVAAEQKLVLHQRKENTPVLARHATSAAILIGPEGGLSESEIVVAENSGFTALSLGPRVLRTETAPLAALAVLQAAWGDMSVS